jgi:hypothetical protein
MAELALAVAFIGSLLVLCVGAATSASDSVVLWVFEASCLFAIGLVVSLELRPRIVGLRAHMAAVRNFRQQLDELPEAPHPLDRMARSRPNRSD